MKKNLLIRRNGYKIPTRLTMKSAGCIAKFWKQCKKMQPCNNTLDTSTKGCVRSKGKDVVCPITQDLIEQSKCFKFISSAGLVHAYDAISLMRYLKASNNYTCPCTRQPFLRTEILRLREKLKKLGDSQICAEAQSLLADFEMRRTHQRTTIEQNYRMLAIENQCGLVLTECLEISENLSLSFQEASVQLLNYLLPEWKYLVDNFMLVSLNDCRAMLIADREKIVRLELNDMIDAHGLLMFIKEAIYAKIRESYHRQQALNFVQSFQPLLIPLFIQDP